MKARDYVENLLNESKESESVLDSLADKYDSYRFIKENNINLDALHKDLNAAMIKLSHLKKEMYKASPGLRDTYQGEIDNLKSYINNLKQKLKES